MRFSVVVCTYNYAHLLPDTLRTIAAQTVPDFELLVVDDGSTDNTQEVVEQYRPHFRDCRYLKKPHTGPADTRNEGVRAAQGSHIAFLDADDLWSPHYLGAVQEAFSTNPDAGLALCEGIKFRTQGKIVTEATLHRELPSLCGPVRSPRELFSVLKAFSPSGMVFSKATYNQVGPFDVRSFGWFSEDVDWTLRALLAGTFCVCLKQRLYLYRRHDANLTNKASDSLRAWLKIYSQTLRESRADPEVEAMARSIIRSLSVRVLPTCSKREGKILLKRGIETLGGDILVRLCYIGTHFGLVTLLKLLKQLRQFSRHVLHGKLAIDLSKSSEAVFDALCE